MPNTNWPTPLVLGGHSFIPELGNDPATGFDEQLAIVNSCLDEGICAFDTTYGPERIALGRILEQLGRRNEAQIIAWNFFTDVPSGKYLLGPRPYAEQDIEKILDDLRTDRVDLLVVHPVRGEEQNKRQVQTANAWVRSGYVGALGPWVPRAESSKRIDAEDRYEFMVGRRNVQNPRSSVFRASKKRGWQTFATSPFDRGQLLDLLIDTAVEFCDDARETLRTRVADAMLRFSLHCPDVDHVIIGIRNRQWISSNLESVSKGPLSPEETRWLMGLQARAEATRERQQNAPASVDKTHSTKYTHQV